MNFYIEGRSRDHESQFFQVLRDKMNKDNVDVFKKIILDKNINELTKRISISEQLTKIDIKINAPTKFIYDNIKKFIEEFEAINFQKIIDILDSNISSKILYFTTYRRIESHSESLKIKHKSKQNNPFW